MRSPVAWGCAFRKLARTLKRPPVYGIIEVSHYGKGESLWQNQRPSTAVRNAVTRAPSGTESAPPAGRGIPWKRMSRCPRRRWKRPPETGGLVREDSGATGRGHLRRCALSHRCGGAGSGAGRRSGAGSIVLLGGEPGIGKSTLLLQICQYFGEAHTVLYVSGEESAKQIKLRAQRLA